MKSSISSINKRIKAEENCKMEQDGSDESMESGYSSSLSTPASASVSTSTTRHLLLDVLTEQFDKNVKISNYLESIGRSVPTTKPMDSYNFGDENVTSINQLADQLRQQAVVENGLLKALCGLFQEMCDIEPAPVKRKRAESTTSSIDNDKESVRTVLKTISENEKELNDSTPKKVKTEIGIKKDANKMNEERQEEYLACDMTVHDEKYLFKNVPKSLVCQYCLKPNDLMECSGKCGGVYHLNCLKLMPTPKHYKSVLMGKPLIFKDQSIAVIKSDNKCVRCTTRPSYVCIFCEEGIKDIVQLCEDDNCCNVFHEKCFDSWLMRQAIKQEKHLCPAHNCQTCKSQIDERSMECLLCSAKYHQSCSCIPAGCQLLSDYQMICVEHSNVRNESQNNIKPLYGDIVWAKLR